VHLHTSLTTVTVCLRNRNCAFASLARCMIHLLSALLLTLFDCCSAHCLSLSEQARCDWDVHPCILVRSKIKCTLTARMTLLPRDVPQPYL
jgi:hypothetical protein